MNKLFIDFFPSPMHTAGFEPAKREAIHLKCIPVDLTWVYVRVCFFGNSFFLCFVFFRQLFFYVCFVFSATPFLYRLNRIIARVAFPKHDFDISHRSSLQMGDELSASHQLAISRRVQSRYVPSEPICLKQKCPVYERTSV